MSRTRLVVGATSLVSLVIAAAASIDAKQSNRRESHRVVIASHLSASAREVARIEQHLLGAEEALLRRDDSQLSAPQRAARVQNILTLRAYRERGQFPLNEHFPHRRVPYFVDSRGTLCAMAHLMASSGRDDIVRRVARERNNATVGELADDPQIVAWLDSAGLTLAEAARIQPTYAPLPPPAEPSITPDYAIASAVSGALGGAGIALNAGGARSQWKVALGFVAGAIGIGVGLHRMDEDGSTRALALVNTAVGATSASLAIVRFAQGRKPRPVAARRRPSGGSLTLTPIVSQGVARAALGANLRF